MALISRSMNSMMCVILVIFYAAPQMDSYGVYDCNKPYRLQSLHANITLGGLFPVHVFKTQNGKGFYVMNLYALTWTQAMLFAIDEINDSPTLLPRYKLGYDIRDSCNNVNLALKESLDFLLDARHVKKESSPSRTCLCAPRESEISAVIGGAASPISTQVSHLFAMNNIPQISYSSTSVSLSNKDIYRSFLRTIPSDTYQAKSIADLLEAFGWSYVSLVASDSEYGRAGKDALKKELKMRRICLAVDALFHPNLYTHELTRIINSLKSQTRSKVIVLWCQRPIALTFLEEATRLGMKGKTWIGTETWGDSYLLRNLEQSTVGGLIGVVPQLKRHSGFETHLAGLHPGNSRRNPWFGEFWSQKFGCEVLKSEENVSDAALIEEFFVYKVNTGADKQTVVCPRKNGRPSATEILPRNKYTNVMDAVYAVALAVESMSKCEGEGLLGRCPSLSPHIKPVELLQYVQNVSFLGWSGTEISFDKNGDLMYGSYALKSLQQDPMNSSRMEFKEIGSWEGASGRLELFKGVEYLWNGWVREAPSSHCNDLCSPGEYPVNGSTRCCWSCVVCPKGYTKQSRGHAPCSACPEGYESNSNRTRCIKMTVDYLSWSSGQAVCVTILSVFGGLLALIFLVIFVRNRETPIVKASNRELSLLHLGCTFFIFTYPFVLIGKPSAAMCAVKPFYFSVFFTISTSITLLKTDRLLRIFRSKSRLSSRSNLLTNKMQIMTAVALTSVPVAIAMLWLLFRPPATEVVNSEKHVRIIRCSSDADTLQVIVLMYVLCLALVCTYFAYRARELPENFNEAKFIGFAMFSFCVFWVSFLPAFYSSTGKDRTFVHCLAILGSALSVLCIMYFQKIRIIVFSPNQNRTEVFRINATTMNIRNRTNSSVPLSSLTPPEARAATALNDQQQNNENRRLSADTISRVTAFAS